MCQGDQDGELPEMRPAQDPQEPRWVALVSALRLPAEPEKTAARRHQARDGRGRKTMNWVSIISYALLAANLAAFAYSIFNIRKYDKIFRRSNDRVAEIVRQMAPLDFSIESHRLRFALYAAMTSAEVSHDAKNVISTALAMAGSVDVDHGQDNRPN
jgi:hypothetical protein